MKDPRWKQANPVDQLVAIRGSLEGHFSNWKDWFNTPHRSVRFIEYFEDHIAQMAALEPFLRGTEPW